MTTSSSAALIVGGTVTEQRLVRDALPAGWSLRTGEPADVLRAPAGSAPALVLCDTAALDLTTLAAVARVATVVAIPRAGTGANDHARLVESGAADIFERPLDPTLCRLRLANLAAAIEARRAADAAARQRTAVLLDTQAALERELAEAQAALVRSNLLASYDPLTGLPNRRRLLELLALEHGRVARGGGSLALLAIDLDRFRTINNALGSDVGDAVLAACARRLEAAVGRGDVVGRMAGDEFMVLLLGGGLDWNERAPQAEETARQLVAALSQPLTAGGREILLSACAGYAVFPGDGDTAGELCRRAGAALRHAKAAGRGRVDGYRPQLDLGAAAEYRDEGQLRRALAADGLCLYYQAKVHVEDGALVGAEALLRWPQPDGSVVGAGEVLRTAEEAQLLEEVERAVVRKAFAAAARWASHLGPDCRISFNLSPQCFQRADLVQWLGREVDAARVEARHLEIEITEGALLGDVTAAAERLAALRAMGFAISLDDFGTGYSSLAYLKQLPLDTLKIAQAFVRDLPQDPRDAAIVRAIVTVAQCLGLKTVVEGVETGDHWEAVRAEGCSVAQGYFFSEPAPAAAFERQLRLLRGSTGRSPAQVE